MNIMQKFMNILVSCVVAAAVWIVATLILVVGFDTKSAIIGLFLPIALAVTAFFLIHRIMGGRNRENPEIQNDKFQPDFQSNGLKHDTISDEFAISLFEDDISGRTSSFNAESTAYNASQRAQRAQNTDPFTVPSAPVQYLIHIRRPGLNGPARIYRVLLDGFEAGRLGAHGQIKIPARIGNHTISFVALGRTERAVTVELTPDSPVAEIEITLDLFGHLQVQMLMGIGRANEMLRSNSSGTGSFGISLVVAIAVILAILVGLGTWAKKSDGSSSSQETRETKSARGSAQNVESGLSAPSMESPEETPAETTYWQYRYVDNWEIGYSGYEIQDKIHYGLGSFTPNENSKFVVVHLKAKNNGTEKDTFASVINIGDALITCKITSGSYSFDSAALLGYRDDLHHKVLNPLESAEGILAFSVPNDIIDWGLTLECSKNGQKAYFAMN